MIHSLLTIALIIQAIFFSLSAVAEDSALGSPQGEWLVKDKTAHIQIVACGQKIWGVISWPETKDTDIHNPDVSHRNDPIVGLPILRAMQADGQGEWSGDIYNADNGKIYSGHIILKSPDRLHVSGCVLAGLICGGEDWTRIAPPPQNADSEICRHIAQ